MINLMTMSEVVDVSVRPRFQGEGAAQSRYVDMDKCVGCGICAESAVKVPNEYDANLVERKAIYIPYAQAVPLKYSTMQEVPKAHQGPLRAVREELPVRRRQL